MTNVTIHITGGIAAYKVPNLIRLFQKNGDQVRVAMTNDARQFVTKTTLEALTKRAVLSDLWDEHNEQPIAHIELADWTELAIVVPATANVIAKLANGIADNAVTSTLIATTAPKIVVPAMNAHMWLNRATQRNIQQLKNDQLVVMTPETGFLAEGYEGQGRMPEPKQIFEFAQTINNGVSEEAALTGKKVLVTAGGTRENIDPVRFIGNHSSGKMGIAIANAAVNAGAEVTLIVGQVGDEGQINPHIKLIHVETSEEMQTAVLTHFKTTDVLIMAAAIADFKPVAVANQKIKKDPHQATISLSLTKTPDILKQVAKQKQSGQIVVGFAAETQSLLENAQKKLVSKNADLIVANDVSKAGIGFGSENNQVTLLRPDQAPEKWDKMSKQAVARKLISVIQTELTR
ncbi:bifunctional phosphopantothenoylcysteine decarboxylase/phosphopantothenate--cysteine ligase CoaBC [Paucilactobacillus sp. N302-9]